MEQLKAIEATEKRLREKVERKERRMREDAERRMELERQARVAAEQRVRQLEELQAKEISKRQQAEVAFRRQQREHEDTTRKFDASSKKIEQLEAHLSSLRLKGEMGDTAQGSRRDGTNQVKLPSIQAPSEQESELLRSSYYVRHLKNLASREIMRGMEEDSSRPAQPSTADPHELASESSANTNTTAAQGSPALVPPSQLNGDGGVVGASSPEQVGAASHRVESLFVFVHEQADIAGVSGCYCCTVLCTCPATGIVRSAGARVACLDFCACRDVRADLIGCSRRYLRWRS